MADTHPYDPFWVGDAPEPPAPPTGPPAGTTKEVLAWVGDNNDRAQEALDVENAGLKRKSLVSALEGILE